jgi:hypothetical protein
MAVPGPAGTSDPGDMEMNKIGYIEINGVVYLSREDLLAAGLLKDFVGVEFPGPEMDFPGIGQDEQGE